MPKVLSVSLLLAASITFPLVAQINARQSVSGRIVPALEGVSHLQVEALDPSSRGGSVAKTQVMNDGSFEFRSLESGSYEFRVVTLRGDVISRAFTNVPSHSDLRFEIRAAAAPSAPPVSLYRLSHRVPGKAQKAWKAAARASSDGRTALAVQHLDAAILADPDFADARHMRGIFALTSDDLAMALTNLARAASLDNANPALLADAAVAHYAARDFPEAVRLARAALRFDPDHQRAALVLSKCRQ